MTTIYKGLFVQLVNRGNGRILFSAATDELKKETFIALWNTIGESIYAGAVTNNADRSNYFELRVDPITESR